MDLDKMDAFNGAGAVAALTIVREFFSFLWGEIQRRRGAAPRSGTAAALVVQEGESPAERVVRLEAGLANLRKSKRRYRLAFIIASLLVFALAFAGRIQLGTIELLAKFGLRVQAVEDIPGRIEVSFAAPTPGPDGYLTPVDASWLSQVRAAAEPARRDGSMIVAYLTSHASRDGASRQDNLRFATRRAEIVAGELEVLGITVVSVSVGSLFRERSARLDDKLVAVKLAKVRFPQRREGENLASAL